MKLYIAYSDEHEGHRPPNGAPHPENPMRLRIAVEALKASGLWSRAHIVVPTEVSLEHVLRVHDADYVDLIRKVSERGGGYLDPDTYVARGTLKAALTAIGASITGVDLLLEKGSALFLSLVRPPGHHAGRCGRALGAPTLGFCVFNNVAAAARYAIDVKRVWPIVIVDFDVHHGNGTQEIFWYEDKVVHVDIHEHGIYPGTGDLEDVGGGDAEGTKINVPLPPYSSDDDYIYVWREVVESLIHLVKPRLVLVSAGFDAYKDDGLASMEVTSRFFRFAASSLAILSRRYLGTLVVLEGGYTVGLRDGLTSFVEGYINEDRSVESYGNPSAVVRNVVNEVRNVVRRFFGTL